MENKDEDRIVIARDGNPVAVLTLYTPEPKERELGKYNGKYALPDEFIKDMDGMGYIPLNSKKEYIQNFQTLGDYSHKNPFDRLLWAQAISEHYHFLTQDEKILVFPSELLL